MSDRDPAPPTGLPPSACRWSAPKSWVAEGRFTSEEPLALWGQERLLSALDILALGATSSDHVQGLDVIGPGRGEATSVQAALAARLPGGVELLPAVTAEGLRGQGRPGILADPEVQAVVLDAHHVARTEGLWAALREALLYGTSTELATAGAGRPPSHRARAHVVIVGPEAARKELREADPAYEHAFVERVALASDLPCDRGGVAVVAQRLRTLARSEGLGEITDGAVCFLVEELAGRPARRRRVAMRTDRALRVLLGARALEPTGPLGVRAMTRAWEALARRGGLQEAVHRTRIEERQLAVRTDGRERGVVNGLMIYGSGDAAYGIPGRITARVSVGREGVINIEREAKYSGRSFDKGIYQLAGWLRGTFAGTHHPLGLAASLAFEQSYGKIDGDSATLAEAIALLSELSGLACRQDLAVTGAVTQRGDLLPIGSVNLKVRGWWESCRAHGPLTGTQGVLLPAASAPDLQIDRAVLADVRAGRFHIYTADRIEDAAEVILGRAAGAGARPGPDRVLGLAARRLRAMSERLHPPRRPPAPAAPPPVKES